MLYLSLNYLAAISAAKLILSELSFLDSITAFSNADERTGTFSIEVLCPGDFAVHNENFIE